MAQFPTSPKTFTARANGQTIDASHVGDLQDEVNAIETGYLDGTARLNSSGSTFAMVSSPTQPRALVFSSVAQQWPADAFTAVTFDSESYDVGALHSTATNPSRITIPAGSSGLYLFGATVRVSSGGSPNAITIRLLKNSTTQVGAGEVNVRSTGSATTIRLTQPAVADAADFFEVEMFPASSTGSCVQASTLYTSHHFWCVKLW